MPPERVGQAWWLSRENKPMDSNTIYVPATELTLPEPRRSVVIKRRWLAAAHAAAHRSRGPPACSGLRSGPEKRSTRRCGCRREAVSWRALRACPKLPMSRHRVGPFRQRCRHGRGHLGCLLGYGIQRDGLGRRLPYTTLEGECTTGQLARGQAEGTSIRTAEGEDACYYERTEPTPAAYPPVWFPPLDFNSGIIKVGVDGVYEDEVEDEAVRKAGIGKSETDADKSEGAKYEASKTG